MAILIEGLNVVVPVQVLEAKYRGGLQAYRRDCPNATFCCDDKLTRVGFMAPPDVKSWIDELQKRGLRPTTGRSFADLAVVDQREGPTMPCPWLTVGRSSDNRVAIVWLRGEEKGKVAFPDGWQYEGSFSQNTIFIPNEEMDEQLVFLRHENGIDVYRDKASGEERFIGRPKVEAHPKEANSKNERPRGILGLLKLRR